LGYRGDLGAAREERGGIRIDMLSRKEDLWGKWKGINKTHPHKTGGRRGSPKLVEISKAKKTRGRVLTYKARRFKRK